MSSLRQLWVTLSTANTFLAGTDADFYLEFALVGRSIKLQDRVRNVGTTCTSAPAPPCGARKIRFGRCDVRFVRGPGHAGGDDAGHVGLVGCTCCCVRFCRCCPTWPATAVPRMSNFWLCL